MADIDRVATVLSERYARVEPTKFGWAVPALNVIDCVLSLNRRYEGFVVPRVELFRAERPDIRLLGELHRAIRSCESPAAFVAAELNYRHEQRANTLVGVVEYLLDELRDVEAADEAEALGIWAGEARAGDYLLVGVRGFGLAGFQYLRMLFGAQTTKPDVHIRSFVAEAVGHPVTDAQALLLMERAAKRLGLPLRDIDNEIWKERSGRG